MSIYQIWYLSPTKLSLNQYFLISVLVFSTRTFALNLMLFSLHRDFNSQWTSNLEYGNRFLNFLNHWNPYSVWNVLHGHLCGLQISSFERIHNQNEYMEPFCCLLSLISMFSISADIKWMAGNKKLFWIFQRYII